MRQHKLLVHWALDISPQDMGHLDNMDILHLDAAPEELYPSWTLPLLDIIFHGHYPSWKLLLMGLWGVYVHYGGLINPQKTHSIDRNPNNQNFINYSWNLFTNFTFFYNTHGGISFG